jgi:hypothetical protein
MKRHGEIAFAANGHGGGEQTIKRKTNIMGDRSPKSISKQASQKQAKAASALHKKQQAIAAKQVAGKKN